jgi:beta-glucanase (GH16 family)
MAMLAAPGPMTTAAVAAPPPAGWQPTFAEEFDRLVDSPDGNKGWTTTGSNGLRTLSSNNESEYYSDASVGVDPFNIRDGVLTITASSGSNPLGLPYNSGMLSTSRSFSQLYGYFEMRASLPEGAGLWPAFWLLPADGSWPPEIDVMEQLGGDPKTIYVGTHSAAGGPNVGTTTAVRVADTARGFHTYGVDWQAETITWYFDGRKIFTERTPEDMHKPMYLIVNLAVGGTGSWPGPPTRATIFPAHFQIDYVRAYKARASGTRP